MASEFLSPDWIAEVRAIRAKYAGQSTPIAATVKINQVVTNVPWGGDAVEVHLDTSSGEAAIDEGLLADADVTLTLDWATARALFVEQDQAAVMQAFLAGKITVQGDMMKLMSLQMLMPTDDAAATVTREIKAITA